MTEIFAVVGVLTIIAVAAFLLVGVTAALITAIKNWLTAKNELLRATKNLSETQIRLMDANNDLNRRLKALESEVRDD